MSGEALILKGLDKDRIIQQAVVVGVQVAGTNDLVPLKVNASGQLEVNSNVSISGISIEVDHNSDSILNYGADSGGTHRIFRTDSVGRLEVVTSGISVSISGLSVDIDHNSDSILGYGIDSVGTHHVFRTDGDGRVEISSSGLDVNVLSTVLATGASTETKQDEIISGINAINAGVNVASSALPSGASTFANQEILISGINSIDGKVATEITLESVKTTVENIYASGIDVDVISSALPTGASTESKQDLLISGIDTIIISGIDVQLDHTDDSVSIYGQDSSGGHHFIRTDSEGRLEVITSGISVSVSGLSVDIDHNSDSILGYGIDSVGTHHVIRTDGDGRIEIISSGLDVNVLSTVLAVGASTEAKQDEIISGINAINAGVNVSSSALPTGASTSANQEILISGINSIDVKVATEITLESVKTTVENIFVSGIDVDVVSSALPTGASTETKQDEIISGINAINIGVNVSSSALPSGASTEAKQDLLISGIDTIIISGIDVQLDHIDDSVSVYGQDSSGGHHFIRTDSEGRLEVITSGISVSISGLSVDIDHNSDSILGYGADSGGTHRVLRTDNEGRMEIFSSGITVLSSALPTGASTEAKQNEIISGINAINVLLTDIEAEQIYVAGTQHFDGVLDTTPVAIVPSGTTYKILTRNTNSSGNLQESFDSGISWFTVEAKDSLEWETGVNYFHLKGVTSGIGYQTLVSLRGL